MSKRKTTEGFIIDAIRIHGYKYDYSLVEYINAYTKVKIICPIHGMFEQTPTSHLSNHGCLKCSFYTYDDKKFKIHANKVHNNFYDYSLMNYENSYTKIKIICPKHGVFEQKPAQHLFGHGCLMCKRDSMFDNKDTFIIKGNKVHNFFYDYSIADYINSYTKVDIICPIHGIFKQKPKDHLNKKQGCPKCKSSKGENIILTYLEQKNIKYISQYKFKLCKNVKPLPFDFYLPEYNMCIEYNGKQHYKPVEWFGGKKTYEYIINNDIIKYYYCKKNNIKLIVIKYDENIETILNEKIRYYI